jgi:4-hydroxybenzoate polyprenyltransferase
VAGWHSIGPDQPVFAIVVQFLLMAWAAFVVTDRSPVLGSDWFRVSEWETSPYRMAGVGLFGRLLGVVGWNRVIARERDYQVTREGMRHLEQHTRRSEVAHLLCVAVGLGLAGAVLLAGTPTGAGWLSLSTIVFQLYPALLQRLVRVRLQRVV